MTKSRSAEVLQLLGLARRAGAAVAGAEPVRRALRAGEARLVLVARDASTVQVAKIRKTLQTWPAPWGVLGDRATLGAAVGRAPVSAVAVTTASFADRLLAKLEPGERGTFHVAEE